MSNPQDMFQQRTILDTFYFVLISYFLQIVLLKEKRWNAFVASVVATPRISQSN